MAPTPRPRPAVRRWALRAITVLAVLAAAGLASMIRLQPLPYPARAESIPLSFVRQAPDLWETEPVAAVATVVGVSWDGQAPRRAWVRSSTDGQEWSRWTPVVIDADHGPDPGTGEYRASRPASEPVFVGAAQMVQFRVETADPGRMRAEVVETTGRTLSLTERARHLWSRVALDPGASAGAVPDQPTILPRSAWGGDACLEGEDHVEPPAYVHRVEAMFVHHTVSSTGYSESEAPAQIYAICRFHVATNGWNDLAYNFVIDRFGNIYEGRAGGIDLGVQGAHTRGLNSYSTGVAFLGTHSTDPPSQAAQDAFVQLAAWKLDVHHVDPVATVALEVLTDNFKYDEGDIAVLPTVSGHRDASSTTCPGDACYVLLPSFRPDIEVTGGNKTYFAAEPDPIPGFQSSGYDPTDLSLRFTTPMEWTLQILRDGKVILADAGTGTSATVVWDGRLDGVNLPYGDYEVWVDATPTQGTDVPRPVRDHVQLGSFLPPFADDDGSVHEADIIELAVLGITKGCNPPANDLYCPSASVTRAQMASFLVRALDLPPAATDRFVDDDGSVHEADIEALAAAGITHGCATDRFCPSDPVTRDQMAAFLVRSLGLQAGAAVDGFIDDQGSIYEADINRLAWAGITKGCNPPANDRYCPTDRVTRAQMASFLVRAFGAA